MYDYFFTGAGAFAGALGLIPFGLAGGGVVVSALPAIPRVVDVVPVVAPPSEVLLYDVDIIHNTNKDAANVQVAFSKKSAVLRTPITWLDEENEEANPPPLEFCTNTTNIRSIQTSIIKIEMIDAIVIYCFC